MLRKTADKGMPPAASLLPLSIYRYLLVRENDILLYRTFGRPSRYTLAAAATTKGAGKPPGAFLRKYNAE
jgi:hypothetical protein